ncbi:MAG TPA: tetratricopeptide repeat protein [Candidatus Sulfotelmatobacter sp.]|nr:tetratricopeptide repeat protein [Candidatus Sulfotelmatobacter sp.]
MTLKNQAIQTALEGNWQEAIELNKSLVHENPEDIDALNRLALAYSITGKLKEAKSAYQKVVKIDPLNPIALRNIKKFKEKNFTLANGNSVAQINNGFLEEPGKTKVVELINMAQPKILESLRTGQSVELSIKRLKIFVSEGKQYIGVLPDDVARRLIKFMNSGSRYDAYIKSSNSHKVTVFLKEIKKSARYKDQPSFTSLSESPLELDKNGRFKARIAEQRAKELEDEEKEEKDENYSDEE